MYVSARAFFLENVFKLWKSYNVKVTVVLCQEK